MQCSVFECDFEAAQDLYSLLTAAGLKVINESSKEDAVRKYKVSDGSEVVSVAEFSVEPSKYIINRIVIFEAHGVIAKMRGIQNLNVVTKVISELDRDDRFRRWS